MRKYRNPKLEEFEKFSYKFASHDEGFLKGVDNQLQLFPPTLDVYSFQDGIQLEYEFNNAGHDYIEICFFTDGHIELYHNYENPDMDIEYEENATSTDVQEIADKFQEIISKINIYS